jgi:hypothetical protein
LLACAARSLLACAASVLATLESFGCHAVGPALPWTVGQHLRQAPNVRAVELGRLQEELLRNDVLLLAPSFAASTSRSASKTKASFDGAGTRVTARRGGAVDDRARGGRANQQHLGRER